jgi:hypothetical protein
MWGKNKMAKKSIAKKGVIVSRNLEDFWKNVETFGQCGYVVVLNE